MPIIGLDPGLDKPCTGLAYSYEPAPSSLLTNTTFPGHAAVGNLSWEFTMMNKNVVQFHTTTLHGGATELGGLQSSKSSSGSNGQAFLTRLLQLGKPMAIAADVDRVFEIDWSCAP